MIQINITPEEREKLTARAKLYQMTLEEYVHLLIEVDIEPEVDPIDSLRRSLEDLKVGRVYSICADDSALAQTPGMNGGDKLVQIEIASEESEKLGEQAKLYAMTIEQYVHRLIREDLAEIDPQEYLRKVLCEPQIGQAVSLTDDNSEAVRILTKMLEEDKYNHE